MKLKTDHSYLAHGAGMVLEEASSEIFTMQFLWGTEREQVIASTLFWELCPPWDKSQRGVRCDHPSS